MLKKMKFDYPRLIYSYDTRNRPTNITTGSLLALNYDYDPAGNVLSLNDLDFTYDRMNRLKTAVSVFDIDYTYDSMGNRTQEVEGVVTTNYTYSNMMRLLSKTEGGVSTSFGYDRNGNLTSKTEGNSSYAYVWDYDNRLKEVRQNGNLLFSYTYDPNGRRVRSLNSGTGTEKYTFTGQFIEAEIGLYYFGARWYDASLGRFISEDPIKGSMTSSQSQNPYVYCMNNPLRYVDPTGMMGDIPDRSLPENYFDGYVNSVGSLINTVVNTATEFAAGVNHGIAAGSNAPNPGTTYCPSSEPGYGSGGQSYRDNPQNNIDESHGLVQITATDSAIAIKTTGEIVVNLNINMNEGVYARWTVGSSVSVPAGGSLSVGGFNEGRIADYRERGYATVQAAYTVGGGLSYKDNNELYGGHFIFGKTAGVDINTPHDLVLIEYYNGQLSGLLVDIYQRIRMFS